MLRADKFSILEDVRTTDIGNAMAVTLSIGIAAGYENFNKNYEMARAAIALKTIDLVFIYLAKFYSI